MSHTTILTSLDLRSSVDLMSKAAFYRALKGATHVQVTNERYPELSGVREVVKVQTNALSLRLPIEHPRYDEVKDGSWTYFDTADRAEGDVYVHVDPLTTAVIARFQVVVPKFRCTECDEIHSTFYRAAKCHWGIGGVEQAS